MSDKISIAQKCDEIIDTLMKRTPDAVPHKQDPFQKHIDKYENLLKRLNDIKELIEKANYSYEQSSRVPVAGLPSGWTRTMPDQMGRVSFHHPTQDVITVEPHQGGFRVRHRGGVVGKAPTITDAGNMVGEYVKNLDTKSVNIYNRPSPNMPAPGMPIPTKMGSSRAGLARPNESEDMGKSENFLANQLADMMRNKSMTNVAPIQEAAFEAMNKGGATSHMNWLEEASKPISSRFSSEEEEIEYWNSIKVHEKEEDISEY